VSIIVNTTSITRNAGQAGQIAYAASKGGVAALTLPMARDLAPYGVRVVAIAPGVFRKRLLITLSSLLLPPPSFHHKRSLTSPSQHT
ncbi:hypothetical protein BC938DRAFT_477693, partial [Jimgerdemannia flammicorona]